MTSFDSSLGLCECYWFSNVVWDKLSSEQIALKNVHPAVIAGMIYFIGGVFLFCIHLTPLCKRILSLFETSEVEAKISGRDLRVLAFVILCGSIIAPLLFLNGSKSNYDD